ncbi:MAG: hypothetical protein V9E94_14155 [Microthrixaceae bacterium]
MAPTTEIAGRRSAINPAAIYDAAVDRVAVDPGRCCGPTSDDDGCRAPRPARAAAPRRSPPSGPCPCHVTAGEDDARRQTCPACGEPERGAVRRPGGGVAGVGGDHHHVRLATTCRPEERKLLAFTDSVQDASHRAALLRRAAPTASTPVP